MPSYESPPASDVPVGAPQEFGSSRYLRGDVALGTYAGFTPYLGAGAGIAGSLHDGSIRIDGGASGVIDPWTGRPVASAVPSHTDHGFSWAAMAGVSYAVTLHTLLDTVTATSTSGARRCRCSPRPRSLTASRPSRCASACAT